MCQTPLDDDAARRPFCSPRCHRIDLAKWLGGEYVVAGHEPVDPALLEELDEGEPGS